MENTNYWNSSLLQSAGQARRTATILPHLDRVQTAFREADVDGLKENKPSSAHPLQCKTTDSSQGDTFTLFPNLPKELRVQIWHHALAPGVITLYRDRDRGRYVDARAVKFMALTTLNPSIEIIPRVCAESLAIFKKRYIEWNVWDVRKSVSTTKFAPSQDVMYFSHGFARNIDHRLLEEFASQYPVQTKQIQTLALPADLSSDSVSGIEILKSLHQFQSLTKLIIVLGHTYGPREQASIPGLNFSWSRLWSERDVGSYRVWNLPDGAQDSLENLQKEQWPDWKIPQVSIARFLDEVLRV